MMQRYCLIMCRSLTYAQRSSQVLERAGITATVLKAPQSVSKTGCTYCVKLYESRLVRALGAPGPRSDPAGEGVSPAGRWHLPGGDGMIYLDSAATSLLKPPSVVRATAMAMRTMASPGRGGHSAAMRAADTVFACREAAARLFHVPEPERVVFTMNATHALNIAIHSLVSPGDPVVISGYEHNSVTRPLHALGAQVRVAESPLFEPEAAVSAFRRALPGAKAAVCTMVSNVFGYLLPVREIAELCAAAGVPLIVDASQAAGCIAFDAAALGAAFVAMPGHKGLLGPQGTASCCALRSRSPCCAAAPVRRACCRICPRNCPTGSRPGRTMSPASRACSPGSGICRRRASRISSGGSGGSRSGLTAQLRAEPRLEVFAGAGSGVSDGGAVCPLPGYGQRIAGADARTVRHCRARGAALRAGGAPLGRNPGDRHRAPEPVAL